MTDPIKPGDGGTTPTIEELNTKIDNLNQGIAKYRDDASTAKKEAAEAKAEAAKAIADAASTRKVIEDATDPEDDKEVKLSPADQKKLEAWAKAQGFTTKAEFEAEKQRVYVDTLRGVETQAVEELLRQHPELEDEKEFAKIKEQFGLYKQPTTLTGYRQILTKVYKEVYGSDDAQARARAVIAQRNRLSIGGGGTQKDDDDKAQMDEYRERYPHLSEGQITARLKEINDLATARAKKLAARKK